MSGLRRGPNREESDMLRVLLDRLETDARITEWEQEFLASLCDVSYWSPRQREILTDIWVKVMGP